jgi:G3E family GTPase
MTENIPFTVIGGYLGAGKTTLLNHLLADARGLRVAVLVNDFGSVNIDVDLIRSHDGDTINLANGCMCCTLINGFASAIGRIRERAGDFDHIVIEASGVADPAKIAQYGQMYELPLDGIIVLADAEQVRSQAVNKYVGDTVQRQFTQADLILLNKTDLVSSDEITSLRAWLDGLAPGTPVIETVRSEVPLAVLFGAHGGQNCVKTEEHAPDSTGHTQTYETWTLERAFSVSRQSIHGFAGGLGEGVYRAKGFVNVEDDPRRRYVYQQVGSRWSLEPGREWNGEPRRTRIVVIGHQGATSSDRLEAAMN